MKQEPRAFEGLTTSQAARRIGVSSSRVIQLAKEGRLSHQWTQFGRLFDEAAVDEYARMRGAA